MLHSNEMASELFAVPRRLEHIAYALLGLAKKMSRHNAESIGWLLPDEYDKVEKEGE